MDLGLGLGWLEVGCCILVLSDALTFGLVFMVEFALCGATCAVGLAVGDFVSLGCLLDVLLFAIVDLVFGGWY